MVLGSNKRIRIGISPGLYLYISVLILLIPLRWLVAVLVSVAAHELFHLAALHCFNVHIFSVRIGVSGIRIHTEPMTAGKELICALAGPCGGIALLLLFRWFPLIAICSGFLTLYNLLPVYPYDGGRALRCGARLALPLKYADRLCKIAEFVSLTAVGVLGFYGTFVMHLGVLPAVFSVMFLQRSRCEKNSLQRE